MTTKAIKIYISYARMDRLLVEDLKKHLMPLQRQGLLEWWDDLEVAPGGNWNLAIDKHLNESDIILLMVSPDFLASDYCYSKEMMYALERHKRGEARVIPIILRPVHWQGAPFSNLQVLPTNGLPVTRSEDRDREFGDIARAILKIIQDYPSAKDFDNVLSIKDKIAPSQHRRLTRRRILTGGIAAASAAISGGGLLLFFRSNAHPPQKSTPTPLPSNILYQADWSSGMAGWGNSKGSVGAQMWTSQNGLLSCSGKLAGIPSSLLITPPYQPPIRDYAVEAEIQFLAIGLKTSSAYFGLIARDPASGSGTFGYLAGVGGNADLNTVFFQEGQQAVISELVRIPFRPDQSWHVYRLELKGNYYSFFVDSALLFQIRDDTFLESGLIGLVSSGCALNVRTFKLFRLG